MYMALNNDRKKDRTEYKALKTTTTTTIHHKLKNYTRSILNNLISVRLPIIAAFCTAGRLTSTIRLTIFFSTGKGTPQL